MAALQLEIDPGRIPVATCVRDKYRNMPRIKRVPHAQAAPPKPLLMVDIDGVLSLFGQADTAPWSARVDGAFHTIDGIPHFLSHTAATHLLGLREHFDLVWASGWEERAEEHLPHLLSLPEGIPFLRFERFRRGEQAHWKLAAIEAYAGDRPLAWIDDALSEACHTWAEARRAPTLLVQTAPERGLTAREVSLLGWWAKQLA
jgi:HAD domain in Swiss Army Knife RNA repair proteins